MKPSVLLTQHTPAIKPPETQTPSRTLKVRDRCLVLCSIAAIAAGCVSNRAYRDHDSRPWANQQAQIDFVQGVQLDQYEPYTAEKPNHRFDLSYIEFDEKGDYWDRRQLGWTVQAIKPTAAAKGCV